MAGIDTLIVTEMITATATDSVADAVDRMTRNRVGAVLIVEDGVLRGLFSERDLLTRVIAANRNPVTTKVWEVATRDLVTIDVREPLKTVLDVFRQRKFRHLPVLDNGKPIGILSTRDFLAYIVEGLDRYIDELRYRRELTEGRDPYDHIGGSYGR